MPRYQNVSVATWRRPSGEAVPPGAVFDATDREHARILRRGHQRARLRLLDGPAVADDATGSAPEAPSGLDGAEAGASAQSPVASPTPPQLVAWPLRMTPEVYLKLHPTGPRTALAQAWVEAAR